MSHISHVFLLRTCQNPNPRDALLRDISLITRHPSHQSKNLDTVFNTQSIGCDKFHPACFSLSSDRAIIFNNYYYRNVFVETWMTFTFKKIVQMFSHTLFSSIKNSTFTTTAVACSLASVLFFTLDAIQQISWAFVVAVRG